MKDYIFARGTEHEALVDGKREMVMSFAGNINGSMGNGISINNKRRSLFWGLVSPRRVLMSYRGANIATCLTNFEQGTLIACWYAGRTKVHQSDQKYVNKIEKQIGRTTRRRILDLVPDNLADVLKELRSRGICFDGGEIQDEVRRGVIRVTPGLQNELDIIEREQELAEQEEYGRLVTIKEAETKLSRDIPGNLGTKFLQVFKSFVDTNRLQCIIFSDFGTNEILIIGKLKGNEEIEVTLRGGWIYSIIGYPRAFIKIGLLRDGDDINYSPRLPDKTLEQKQGMFHERLVKPIKRLVGMEPESDNITISCKFPLFNRKYGAEVKPKIGSKCDSSEIQLNVNDVALFEAGERFYQSLK